MSIRYHMQWILEHVETKGIVAVQKKLQLHLVTELSEKSPRSLLTVATPNPEQVVQSSEDAQFWQDLQQFDLFLPDGIGLVWANWWLKYVRHEESLPAKIRRAAGRTVVEWWLFHAPNRADHTVFLLGAKPGIAEQLAHKVDPDQTWCFGSFGYTNIRDLWARTPTQQTQEEHHRVLQFLQEVRPNIVFVAFGAPHQEHWIQQYRDQLEQNGVKIAFVCGGSFDVLVGNVRKAPTFLTVLGLEWLWRLILQPWRWHRQVRLIQFVRALF